ncbi:MAG: hypothetical protein SFY69_00435 [Planctomycetota bacterium]|nr:hypothetical protein [Planctomycetota bacterium]
MKTVTGIVPGIVPPPRAVELVVSDPPAPSPPSEWPQWVIAAGCVVVLVAIVHRWIALRLERDTPERAFRALARLQGLTRAERDLALRVAERARCGGAGVLVSDHALASGAHVLARESPADAPRLFAFLAARGVTPRFGVAPGRRGTRRAGAVMGTVVPARAGRGDRTPGRSG